MDKLRVYLIEEQEILREAYKVALQADGSIELVGVSENGSSEAIVSSLASLSPDVVLMGIKTLHVGVIEKLAAIHDSYPQVGLVLLAALYDVKGIQQLREFARRGPKGCAFLLKHSVDRIAQLTQIIHSVTDGQVIVDSMVMEGLIESSDRGSTFLKELTSREMEVLSWMSKGFKNGTIAEVLAVEPKTIERHINSIYGKLSIASESKHPRVSAIMLYLRATGQLPAEDFVRE